MAGFNEDTLDKLVATALARVERLEGEIKDEGEIVEHEFRGVIANPKIKLLQEEREWVRKAWATKFREGSQQRPAQDDEKDYFAKGPP